MLANTSTSHTVGNDGHVDEVGPSTLYPLHDSNEFPPLTSVATAEGWDCINNREAEDVVVHSSNDGWEQLDLANTQNQNLGFCFATVAKQTMHVPTPEPKLVALAPVFDKPMKRRQKPEKEPDTDDFDGFDEQDIYIYPVAVGPAQRDRGMAKQKKLLMDTFGTIPSRTPEELVIADERMHSMYSYSEPLTAHQYQHATFKYVQMHQHDVSVFRNRTPMPAPRKTKYAHHTTVEI
ncbi:hypothetical protein INT43_006688 [Umbelopsis isabellina]|uniref:Uncharacterized protein n=1 Tax=Mortierella isabellina TaxID=91625 RepID=A0A8H7UHW4_MORIS|nr:hypothetical protein INT43_006688 [Umbelopsis isabellina]